MPAITNPSTQPLQAPEKVAPSPLSSPPTKPSNRKRWFLLAVIVVLAAGVAYRYWWKPRQQPAAAAMEVRTARVAIGNLEQTRRITGTSSARNFVVITGPIIRRPDFGRGMVLMKLINSGSMVRKGDVLAEIDTQSLRDHIDDVIAYVNDAEGNLRKRQADQAIENETRNQTLRVAQATLDKAKLDAGAAEVKTVIDQQLLKLAVDEAEAQYKNAQEAIRLMKVANTAELRVFEITRQRQLRHVDAHKLDIPGFTVRAPMAGLAVMITSRHGGGGDDRQTQEGDQVSPGEPFMRIVDLSSIQLDAVVNQVAAETLRIGQSAHVRFDAFPDLVLPGKIYSVGALAISLSRTQNNWVRSVPVRIAIQGRDSRLIPDLSASADVVEGRAENAVLVSLAAVDSRGGKTVVYVKQGPKFGVREVELGVRNNTHAAVTSGLKAGEEVALSRPPAAQLAF